MEPDPRRAIVDRREQVASEPRPVPLRAAPSERDDTEDIFRLYRPEWVVVHTEIAAFGTSQADLIGLCQHHFDANYAGRVRAEDVSFQSSGSGRDAVAHLLLCLPTLKGEFKHAHLAGAHAERQGYHDATVVVRNSAADHAIRAYSVVKLPKAPP